MKLYLITITDAKTPGKRNRNVSTFCVLGETSEAARHALETQYPSRFAPGDTVAVELLEDGIYNCGIALVK